MTFSTNPESGRATIRFGDDLLDAIDSAADALGMDRSEFVRSAVAEAVEEVDTSDYPTPDDPMLAAAYESLLSAAGRPIDGAGLRLTREEARSELYSNDIPKDAVMDSLIRPLRKNGWVRIDAGMSRVWIVVRPPNPRGGNE